MSVRNQRMGYLPRILAVMSLCLSVNLYSQSRTSPSQQKAGQADHTIHVNVGLVQTDVMVFDRQGHFVPDLKMDQFELRVDGKPQPISFCELVSAGSSHDEELWARAEGKPVTAPPPPAVAGANPGRTLLFFLDDWHLSAEDFMRSRMALSNLINTSVGPNDRVAILAASGQLGSAQQLTNDKATLLSTLEKFNFQSAGVEDLTWPPMTENQALLIEQRDSDVLTYFVQAIVGRPVNLDSNMYQSVDVQEAIRLIKRKAADLAQLSAGIDERSLGALRNFLRSAEALPGRKLVFLLSDGFVLQPQRGDIVSRIGEVTTAAARAGIVVYTLDARGLVVGLPDAKVKRGPDMTGALAHSGSNEAAAPMDALNALAADTGGRFLKNTNALDTALITTLAEISRYYLLAWAIDPDKLQPGKYSTIRAIVKGRSDLSVRVRQGSLDLSQLVSKKQEIR
jgi:VWFA-related protein